MLARNQSDHYRARGEIALTLSIIGLFVSLIGIGLGTYSANQLRTTASRAQSDPFPYESIMEVRQGSASGPLVNWEEGLRWQNNFSTTVNEGDVNDGAGKARVTLSTSSLTNDLRDQTAFVTLTVPSSMQIIGTFCEDRAGNTCATHQVTADKRQIWNMRLRKDAKITYGWIVNGGSTGTPIPTPTPDTGGGGGGGGQPVPTTPPGGGGGGGGGGQPGIGNLEVQIVALNYPKRTSFWSGDHIASKEPTSCERLPSSSQQRPLYLNKVSVVATCIAGDCTVGKEYEGKNEKNQGYVNFNGKPTGTYRIDRVVDIDGKGFSLWDGCRNKTFTIEKDKINQQAVMILQNRTDGTYETYTTESKCKSDGGEPNLIQGIGGNLCYLPQGKPAPVQPTSAPGGGGGGGGGSSDLVCTQKCIYSQGTPTNFKCYEGACPKDRPDCGGNTPKERIDNGNKGCQFAGTQCGLPANEVSCTTGERIGGSGGGGGGPAPTSAPQPTIAKPQPNRATIQMNILVQNDYFSGGTRVAPFKAELCDLQSSGTVVNCALLMAGNKEQNVKIPQRAGTSDHRYTAAMENVGAGSKILRLSAFHAFYSLKYTGCDSTKIALSGCPLNLEAGKIRPIDITFTRKSPAPKSDLVVSFSYTGEFIDGGRLAYRIPKLCDAPAVRGAYGICNNQILPEGQSVMKDVYFQKNPNIKIAVYTFKNVEIGKQYYIYDASGRYRATRGTSSDTKVHPNNWSKYCTDYSNDGACLFTSQRNQRLNFQYSLPSGDAQPTVAPSAVPNPTSVPEPTPTIPTVEACKHLKGEPNAQERVVFIPVGFENLEVAEKYAVQYANLVNEDYLPNYSNNFSFALFPEIQPVGTFGCKPGRTTHFACSQLEKNLAPLYAQECKPTIRVVMYPRDWEYVTDEGATLGGASSAIFNLMFMPTSDLNSEQNFRVNSFIHELGHVLPFLADEYIYSGSIVNSVIFASKPNCSLLNPITQTCKWGERGECIKGCGESDLLYRPSTSSIMNVGEFESDKFNQVSLDAWEKYFSSQLSGLDANQFEASYKNSISLHLIQSSENSINLQSINVKSTYPRSVKNFPDSIDSYKITITNSSNDTLNEQYISKYNELTHINTRSLIEDIFIDLPYYEQASSIVVTNESGEMLLTINLADYDLAPPTTFAPGSLCGNAVCDAGIGEDANSCRADCGEHLRFSEPERADFNDDKVVNTTDLTLMTAPETYQASEAGDVNGDGFTNALDYTLVLKWWEFAF